MKSNTSGNIGCAAVLIVLILGITAYKIAAVIYGH